MSRKKLALVLSLSLAAVVVIAGGVVFAQETVAPPTEPMTVMLDEMAQEPSRSLSIFLDDGAFLGVGTEDVSRDNMARYGMRDVRGVGVTEVVKDSPAEKAGLRKDDVILRFDGESVTSVRKLTRLVSEHAPDQSVRITISRGGAEQELTATLAKQKPDTVFRNVGPTIWKSGDNDNFRVLPNGNWPPAIGGGNNGSFVWTLGSNRRIGVSTQSMSQQLADYFGAKDGGVLITSVSDNSPASKAGLKAGDIITAIDGEKVKSPSDLSQGLSKKETGDVTLTIIRDRSTRTVTVTPEKNPNADIFKTGNLGTRRLTIPSIVVPTIPQMNIEIPEIRIPATPPINVTVPARAPRLRTRTVII